MRAARAATAMASPASGPSTSRAGATSWERTMAAAAGVAGSRCWRAAASARRNGPARARLASRSSMAWSLRRWFRPVTGCGGSSASAERTTSHSANSPCRAGPRTAAAPRPIRRPSAGEAAVFGPADDDALVPGRAQALAQGDPVRDGPAFGGVGGAGPERGERRAGEAALGQPLRHPRGGARAEAELGRTAVGPGVEPARGLEVALGHGHGPAVRVELGGDEQRAGQLALAVPGPAAAYQQAEPGAAEAAVQVEPMRRRQGPQPPGQVAERLVRLERHDFRHV